MGKTTGILWTDSTWNPATGCTKVSPGCDNCYAEVVAERFRGGPAWPNGFDLQLRPKRLNEPVHWRDARRIFVNSMSDLFHKGIPNDYLMEIWDVMVRKAPQHTYQILTKRPHVAAQRIQDLKLALPPNIWLGVSVENQKLADSRIPVLLDIPAQVRFLSCEPLLGPVDLSPWLHQVNACQTQPVTQDSRDSLRALTKAAARMIGPTLDWVITGAESGANRRAMDLQWVRDIRDQCLPAGVAFFHKQGSAMGPDQNRILDGRTWDEYPAFEVGQRQLQLEGIR